MRKASTIDTKERSARSFKKAAWWLALLACVFPIAFRQVTVSDAWWHVALGKWLIEKRSVPDLSQFYFSPWDDGQLLSELRWEWLGDILLYLFHAVFGAFGLQILVIACLIGSAWFLVKLAGDRLRPWTLLLLVVVCVGTYQLQMPRNSLFSLALYPAVLWLGCRRRGEVSMREYLLMGAVLLLWSCLHGSCVLGWVTAAVILSSRALMAFRKDGGWHLKSGFRSIVVCGLFCGASLLLVVAGRTGAVNFLTLPARHVAASIDSKANANTTPTMAVASSEGAASAHNWKEWLNSSIWKPDHSVPWSNDYWSPIDMLPGMRPIEAAYALAVAALICVACFRNVPVGLLMAWVGAVFLGLGYVRMFGYTALTSAAVILVATRNVRARAFFSWLGWPGVGAWIVFSWWMFFSKQVENFIPEGQHVSRVGQVPIYDDTTADWVKAEFPSERVFTTIESGSYCLLRWNFEKQVFLDGFFAPHTREVWNGYNKALRSGDPEVLHTQFGIKVAIVPTTSPQWVEVFLNSPDWNAVAVGPGSVVFVHRSIPLAGRNPGIFFTAGQLRETSFYFRSSTMRALFQIVSSAGSDRGAFRSEQWTAHPSFKGLRDLAKEVFPSL